MFNIRYRLHCRTIMNLCFFRTLKFGYVEGQKLSLVFYLLGEGLMIILSLPKDLEKQTIY